MLSRAPNQNAFHPDRLCLFHFHASFHHLGNSEACTDALANGAHLPPPCVYGFHHKHHRRGNQVTNITNPNAINTVHDLLRLLVTRHRVNLIASFLYGELDAVQKAHVRPL